MRRLGFALGFLAVPATAHAEVRLDLGQIPDVSLFETAYPLDRHAGRRTSGIAGWLAIGAGSNDGQSDAVGTATLVLGKRTDHVVVAATSELTGAGLDLVRGRHRGLLEVKLDDGDDELRGVVTVEGGIDHGKAPALAPVHLGPGQRDNADAAVQTLLVFGPEKDDTTWVLAVKGEAGATRWSDVAIDGADRRALGLGWGRTPLDGEIPRGTIDLVRGRVEHASIRRPIAAAASAPLDAEVRTVELGLGADDLTFHVDREILAVIAVDLGWTWLEADTATGPIADNLFRMRLSSGLRWRTERDQLRSLGIAIARVPDYTADGQRLVSDVRTELSGAMETPRVVLGARGGISWLHALAGGAPASRLIRYGSHLEGFVKLAHGVELGGYHATSFEPQLAGDPWASPRRWATELGVVVRWRMGSPKVRPGAREHPCGGTGEDSPLPERGERDPMPDEPHPVRHRAPPFLD